MCVLQTIFTFSPYSICIIFDIIFNSAVELAPNLCRNFLALCASNQYNNTKFHRNIASFMIQGGDPTGSGKGGTAINGGYLDDEFPSTSSTSSTDGLFNSHDRRGIVSMANKGPNTNASQFFITYKELRHLDGKYSIIGGVLDGWETLQKMESIPVTGKKNTPVSDILLQTVTIHANPFAP